MNRTEKLKPSKGIFKRFAKWLKNLAFLEILEYLGRLSVIFAVIFFFWEHGDRQKAKHYQAWQVINTAQGKPGNGGRTDALQDLNNDGISLVGVDLSMAYLEDIQLKNADLSNANLSGANLSNANLSRANLGGANLSGTDLLWANLSGANLWGANLSGAILWFADLSGADLGDTNLSGADIRRANLSGANIGGNLSEVNLGEANLSGADLSNANLSGANLGYANLLQQTNPSGAILWVADLSGIRSDANFSGLIFANTSGAIRGDANISGANLSNANLSGANLRNAKLSDVKNWRKIKSMKNANIYQIRNAPEGFIKWAEEQGAINLDKEIIEK